MRRKISDLRVADLKQELEKRGIESRGLKGVLVQRLQKAIEEEGGDSSEIDISASESSSSPKVSRRGTPRSKRGGGNTTDENDEITAVSFALLEDEKPVSVTVNTFQEKSDASAEDEEKVQNGEVEAKIEVVEPVIEESSVEPVIEETPAEPEDQASNDLTPASKVIEEAVPENPIEEEVPENPIEEEVFGEADGKGNDFRTDEEPTIEQTEEIEEEIAEDEQDEEPCQPEVEVEMVEVKDSEGLEESEAEEIMQTGEEEIVITEEEEATVEDVEKIEGIEVVPEITLKSDNEKKKIDPNTKDQEVVVSTEVDVLDMLDYDLEITGDHTNLSSEDRRDNKKDETAENVQPNTTDGNKESPKTSTTDRKTRTSSDSVKNASSTESAGDQQISGSQSSSTKSATPASKDGAKSASSGKRDSTSSSTAKKDDNPNKNLWISGLSSTTRASELKAAFSRYGKVIGAKVVTNVKSPGSRCYGFVTMATVEAANKCILHLNNTEMHGRNITVEIAKGDPSASSKKQTSNSSSSAKKDTDAKDNANKTKEAENKTSATSNRRSSTAGQSTGKSTKDQKTQESKKTANSDQQSKDAATKKPTDDNKKNGRSKSPIRDRNRAERTASGPRSGDKRASNRSPMLRNRGSSKSGYGKDEPERKRLRQPDSADRKVVMDSHKGELRVNVSGTNRPADDHRDARWEGHGRPKPLVTRRRSLSPIRQRNMSPLRGQGMLRNAAPSSRGARGRRGGRGGLLTRQIPSRGTSGRSQRGSKILSFNQIRAQQRDRERGRSDRGRPERGRGRGSLSRGGYSQNSHMHVERDRLRREREEREKLRIERERLERERRQLEKDRQERERLEQERLRLEAERKRELERIEREKAEMRRLQEITRYEVEQRQRAIKRTYDDDTSGHRGSRSSNRDSYDTKRVMMSERDIRTDNRRGERDDRRGYDSYSSRDSSRNGPQQSQSFRQSQNSSYRGATGSSGHSKMGSNYHQENRRGPMSSDAHHDSDTRYGGTGGSGIVGRSGNVGRSVEKYVRRDSNRAMEYGHGYDRENSNDSRHAVDSPPVRRRGQQRETGGRDGRKVVSRDKPDHRGGSPEFRRTGRPSGARVEITRVEQSPPVRRARRESPPPGVTRGAAWRDPKTSSARREDDRDLREQIRGSRPVREGSGPYSASRERERPSQRRGGSPSSDSDSAGHSDPPYTGRWPEEAPESATAQQIYAVSNSTNPSQAGRSSAAAGWHVAAAQWPQQSVPPSARAQWPGSALPSAASAVGRPITLATAYGGVPSAALPIQPPGTTIIPATQAYIPATDRQARAFQASYKQITRRY